VVQPDRLPSQAVPWTLLANRQGVARSYKGMHTVVFSCVSKCCLTSPGAQFQDAAARSVIYVPQARSDEAIQSFIDKPRYVEYASSALACGTGTVDAARS
jgi:hypothetical protein